MSTSTTTYTFTRSMPTYTVRFTFTAQARNIDKLPLRYRRKLQLEQVKIPKTYVVIAYIVGSRQEEDPSVRELGDPEVSTDKSEYMPKSFFNEATEPLSFYTQDFDANFVYPLRKYVSSEAKKRGLSLEEVEIDLKALQQNAQLYEQRVKEVQFFRLARRVAVSKAKKRRTK